MQTRLHLLEANLLNEKEKNERLQKDIKSMQEMVNAAEAKCTVYENNCATLRQTIADWETRYSILEGDATMCRNALVQITSGMNDRGIQSGMMRMVEVLEYMVNAKKFLITANPDYGNIEFPLTTRANNALADLDMSLNADQLADINRFMEDGYPHTLQN